MDWDKVADFGQKFWIMCMQTWRSVDLVWFWGHFWKETQKIHTKGIRKFVSMGDPLVVSLCIFIVLSPFALVYIIMARIAMTRLTQFTIRGKNILYVIAHPDDEAM